MNLKHLSPALICSAIVMVLCLMPGQNLPRVGVINFDKGVHSLMFAGLTALYAQGFHRQVAQSLLKRHCLFMAFVWCTLYGGLIEILQATVSVNRSGDWLDFLFDGLGALAAIVLWDPERRSPRYGIQYSPPRLSADRERRPK
ncbi:MAG: VanZ family protein [Gammaproteobacteria bacterium]